MSARDDEIKRATETADLRRYQETRIEQKVQQAYREAFYEKFPGQIEHCMRLVAERLQTGLRKDGDVQLSDCSAKDLSWALLNLYKIHTDLKIPHGR